MHRLSSLLILVTLGCSTRAVLDTGESAQVDSGQTFDTADCSNVDCGPAATIVVAGLPDSGTVHMQLSGGQGDMFLQCMLESDNLVCDGDGDAGGLSTTYDSSTDTATWDFFWDVPEHLEIVHEADALYDDAIPYTDEANACCEWQEAEIEL